MLVKKLTILTFLLVATPALADDPLPAKMEGKWYRGSAFSQKAEVELLGMESPTKAKLKVVFWDGCTRRGETTAELKNGTWEFVAPGGGRCDNVPVKIQKVEGKNKFEGTYIGPRGEGSVELDY